MLENLHDACKALTDAPWKAGNEIRRRLCYPPARLLFAFYGVPWGHGWKLYGKPILQKHRRSTIKIGDFLQLRSSISSNPLAPQHPVLLCAWKQGALLEIGDYFGMTGGVLCASERISIGSRVRIGANATILDTDFHPLDPITRSQHPKNAKCAPITIEDDVFIGMNSVVLKGVTLGRGCVVGAGSVVTKDIPKYSIAAGNPARVIGKISSNEKFTNSPDSLFQHS